jgi:hypothetical protein
MGAAYVFVVYLYFLSTAFHVALLSVWPLYSLIAVEVVTFVNTEDLQRGSTQAILHYFREVNVGRSIEI